MKTLLISLALFAGQMISMQEKPVVHLRPHADIIDVQYGGSLLELQNAPEYVHLPVQPPKADPQGTQWFIDIKNFGPRPVSIVDKAHFNLKINISQTVHIYSNGISYYEKR
jgi:hypothetical protein